MKTTIDLPAELLHRAKAVAAQRKTTLKQLVQAGLERVLEENEVSLVRRAALERLREGLHLGGKPLTRDQAHERS